eukprot:3915677-Pleurochrysis_carterae.AAC.1
MSTHGYGRRTVVCTTRTPRGPVRDRCMPRRHAAACSGSAHAICARLRPARALRARASRARPRRSGC